MGLRNMLNIANDVRFLLDENISPNIAPQLWEEGVDAVPIRDRSMLRASDYRVLQVAQKEKRAVATINEYDFERLALKMAQHAGIAVIPSGGSRDEQFEYVRAIAKFWMASQNAISAAINRITTVDENLNVTSRLAYLAEAPSVVRFGINPTAG